MGNITLTDDTLRYMSLFETVTKARSIDCIERTNKIIFIVPKTQVGLAIGKQGENIKRLKDLMKKNIDIIGYSQDIEIFIRSIFHNYTIREVKLEKRGDTSIAYVTVDIREKGKIIGKGGENLKLAKEIVSRHYDIGDIIIS